MGNAKMKKKPASKQRDWLTGMLWADEKVITESVESYNKTPWYSTYRFWLMALVTGLFFVSGIVMHEIASFFLLLTILVPMWYFAMRGYRFCFVLLGLFKIVDIIIQIPGMQNGSVSVVWALFWLALWLGLCITCYRIETLRRTKNKDSKRVTKLDKFVFVVLGLVLVFFIGSYTWSMMDPQSQLEDKYGRQNVETASEIYVRTVVIPEICRTRWEALATANGTTYDDLHEKYLLLYIRTYPDDAEFFQKQPELLTEVRDKLGAKLTKGSVKYIKNQLNDSKLETMEETYDSFCRGALFIMLEEQQAKQAAASANEKEEPVAEQKKTAPEQKKAVAESTKTPKFRKPVKEIFNAYVKKDARVVFQIETESWIKITDGPGNVVFSRVLMPGDVYYVPLTKGLKGTFGNAGGIDIWVDGVLLKKLGPVNTRKENVSLDPTALKALGAAK